MLFLLKQRPFFLLWLANTLSMLGDYVFFVAITFWVYTQTRSAVATGAVLITSTIPAFLFAPLARSWVDRWDRRRLMLVVEMARALLFLGLFVSLRSIPSTLWPIYVVGFCQTALGAFFGPARGALLPHLIPPSALVRANALALLSESGVRMLAPSLSAFALVQMGPSGVALLDAMTFLISAGDLSLLVFPPHLPKERSLLVAPHATKSPSGGLPLHPPARLPRLVRWKPWEHWLTSPIRDVVGLGFLIAYTGGTMSVLVPIFVRTTLSAGPFTYGWFLTSQALGEGVMSLLLAGSLPRPASVKGSSLIMGSFVIGGCSLILLACLRSIVPALLLSLILGAMMAAISVHLVTLIPQRVVNLRLGRAFVTYAAGQAFAQVSGMGLATMMVGWLGAPPLLMIMGILLLLGSGFTGKLWR